jgi:hypothetical protein
LQRDPYNEGSREKALEQGIVQFSGDAEALQTAFLAKIELAQALISVNKTEPSANFSGCTGNRIALPRQGLPHFRARPQTILHTLRNSVFHNPPFFVANRTCCNPRAKAKQLRRHERFAKG